MDTFLPSVCSCQTQVSHPAWGNRPDHARPLCSDGRACGWAKGRMVLTTTLVKPMPSVLLLHAVTSKVPVRRRKKFMHRGEVKVSVMYNRQLGGK